MLLWAGLQHRLAEGSMFTVPPVRKVRRGGAQSQKKLVKATLKSKAQQVNIGLGCCWVLNTPELQNFFSSPVGYCGYSSLYGFKG